MEMKDNLFALLMVAVIVFGIWGLASSGVINLGAGSVTSQPVGISTTGGICDNGNNQPVVSYGGYWVDPTNNNVKTSATSLAQFFIPGEAVQRVYTSFIGGNSSTAGNLACGQAYNLLLGDGGNVTYYYSQVSVPALSKTTTTVGQAQLTRAGSPSIAISNATSFELAQVTISNATFTSGNIGTATIKTIITKSNDGTIFGDMGWGICLRYNATSFDWWHPQSAYVSEYSQGVLQGTTGKTKVQCFKMSNSPITGGRIEVGLEGKCASAVSCAGVNDAVDIYLQDFTGVLFNGNLVPGTDNTVGSGASTNVGRSDPNLQAAVLFADG